MVYISVKKMSTRNSNTNEEVLAEAYVKAIIEDILGEAVDYIINDSEGMESSG